MTTSRFYGELIYNIYLPIHSKYLPNPPTKKIIKSTKRHVKHDPMTSELKFPIPTSQFILRQASYCLRNPVVFNTTAKVLAEST